MLNWEGREAPIERVKWYPRTTFRFTVV